MGGPLVDFGYERISNTLFINSALKIHKMTLGCKNQIQKSAFQSSENFYFENCSQGPTMVGP